MVHLKLFSCIHQLASTLQWLCFRIYSSYSGPSLIRIAWDQISEIFGLVKATAATCVIVTAHYLHSVLGSLGSLPLLHVHRTQNKNYLLATPA